MADKKEMIGHNTRLKLTEFTVVLKPIYYNYTYMLMGNIYGKGI